MLVYSFGTVTSRFKNNSVFQYLQAKGNSPSDGQIPQSHCQCRHQNVESRQSVAALLYNSLDCAIQVESPNLLVIIRNRAKYRLIICRLGCRPSWRVFNNYHSKAREISPDNLPIRGCRPSWLIIRCYLFYYSTNSQYNIFKSLRNCGFAALCETSDESWQPRNIAG